MEFTEILRGRYGLSERAAGVLMRHASQSVHARKEIIVEEGQRDQEIRFVTEGSARSYVMREDKCVILSFAFEGDPTSSTLGAWPGGISGHTIETMEPTTLVRLPREEIDRLFAADAELADWGRRMAEEQLRRRARHYLALPVEGGMRRLDSSLIYYLESEGHRVHFYTEEGDFVAAGTLKAFEEKLAERPFARCNSGYLVNLAQVKSVQQGMVQVGPYELQVSRPRRKAFLAALADHIGGEGA